MTMIPTLLTTSYTTSEVASHQTPQTACGAD